MNVISFKQRFVAQILAAVALFSLVAGLVPMQAFANHDPFNAAPQTSVKLCHSGNGKNFTANSPSITATGGNINLAGHEGHDSDIIPPFHYNINGAILSYPGKNWNASGQEQWAKEECNDKIVAPITATVTVNKVVLGGDDAATAFGFQVNGGATVSFDSDASVPQTVNLGAYSVVESGVTAGKVIIGADQYTVSYGAGCSGTLAANTTCTITNTYVTPAPATATLTITKVISGIQGVLSSAFSYILNNGAAVSFSNSNTATLNVGSAYTVAESGVTAGNVTVDGKSYAVTYNNCSNSLTAQGSVCTITNTYIPTCFDGIRNQNETAIDQGGICAMVVNGCTDSNASNYLQGATPGNPQATNCTYAIAACQTTSPLLTTNLSTWDLSQTQVKGHNELVDGGLRIYTESNTSTDKAAGYYTTNFPLRNLGTQTIANALDYNATIGIEPGLQLVIDFDNNNTVDGILVGESIYGENWWLTNSAQQFVKDGAPLTGGGNGSNWFGTATQWLNKFPNAQVKAIGYSLGSGVYGDGVITSIELGCVDYTFDIAPQEVLGCTNPAATNYNQGATVGNAQATNCDFNYTSQCGDNPNILLNGSFEQPVIAGPWTASAVTNWVVTKVSDGTTTLSEIWRGLSPSSNGAQHLELDGTEPAKITQTVTTIPGATYELRLDFAARAGYGEADNSVLAKADVTTITNTATDNTAWTTYGGTFVADGSTDIAVADTGTANSLGTLVDNAVLCLVREPAPVDFCPNIDAAQSADDGYLKDANGQCYIPITSCSVNVVSDTTNTVNAAPALLVTPNPAWVATIPSSLAKWIWGTSPNLPIDPVVDEVQTFKKTFVWSGTPSTAMLKISSDNGYSVKLNGFVVGSDADEFNYQSLDTIINLTDDIIVGVNTLEISVTNKANGQTSWSSNPGGLMYDLTITNTTGNCAPGGDDGGGNNEDDLSCTITVDDSSIRRGQDVNVTWDSSINAVSAMLNGVAVALDDTQLFENLRADTTYTLTIMGENEQPETCSVTVDTRGGGGGGGSNNNNNDDEPDGDVLGDSDDADEPEGEVAGDQVSTVPTGAPNAGNGGTSPFAQTLGGIVPIAFVRRSRHG